jgi:hypothetical protein
MQILDDDQDGLRDDNLRANLEEYLGPSSSKEVEWLGDCIVQGMKHYLEVEHHRRVLRLPLILAEENYVVELRRGAALRSLRRIYMTCRVERIMRDCVNGIIAGEYFSDKF